MLHVLWVKSRKLEFRNLLTTQLMDTARYISVLDARFYSILDDLLSKSRKELLSVGIRGLVKLMQVHHYMEELDIKNEYMAFLGIR